MTQTTPPNDPPAAPSMARNSLIAITPTQARQLAVIGAGLESFIANIRLTLNARRPSTANRPSTLTLGGEQTDIYGLLERLERAYQSHLETVNMATQMRLMAEEVLKSARNSLFEANLVSGGSVGERVASVGGVDGERPVFRQPVYRTPAVESLSVETTVEERPTVQAPAQVQPITINIIINGTATPTINYGADPNPPGSPPSAPIIVTPPTPPAPTVPSESTSPLPDSSVNDTCARPARHIPRPARRSNFNLPYSAYLALIRNANAGSSSQEPLPAEGPNDTQRTFVSSCRSGAAAQVGSDRGTGADGGQEIVREDTSGRVKNKPCHVCESEAGPGVLECLWFGDRVPCVQCESKNIEGEFCTEGRGPMYRDLLERGGEDRG